MISPSLFSITLDLYFKVPSSSIEFLRSLQSSFLIDRLYIHLVTYLEIFSSNLFSSILGVKNGASSKLFILIYDL